MLMIHFNHQARMAQSIATMSSILPRLQDILREIFMALGAQEARATAPRCLHQSPSQTTLVLLTPTTVKPSASSPFMFKSISQRKPTMQAIDLVDIQSSRLRMHKLSTLLLVASSLQSKFSTSPSLVLSFFFLRHFHRWFILTSHSLLQSENEDSLQMAVTQVFREYGPVYVKIRRDGKHMPFAFCQYTVGCYQAVLLLFSANYY